LLFFCFLYSAHLLDTFLESSESTLACIVFPSSVIGMTLTQRLAILQSASFIILSFPFLPTVPKKKHIARAVTMKISPVAASLLAAASTGTTGFAGVQAFVSSPASARCAGQPNIRLSGLSMSSNGPDDDMLKQSAEAMKNMRPEDIDRMMAEMESMGPAQKVGRYHVISLR